MGGTDLDVRDKDHADEVVAGRQIDKCRNPFPWVVDVYGGDKENGGDGGGDRYFFSEVRALRSTAGPRLPEPVFLPAFLPRGDGAVPVPVVTWVVAAFRQALVVVGGWRPGRSRVLFILPVPFDLLRRSRRARRCRFF